MAVSDQVVVRCDYDGCRQLVTFERTEFPADRTEVPAFLAGRGWSATKPVGRTQVYNHCTGHSRELAKFFAGPSSAEPAPA